ncbi:DUF4136 domain-containing protein [Kaarinaea lacus]
MKINRIIAVTSLLLLVNACAQISTKTELDKSTDFSRLKTYQWGKSTTEMQKTGKTLDRVIEDIGTIAEDNIPSAVDDELAAKGYTQIKEGKPDFIIQYALKSTVEEQFRRETYVPGATNITPMDQAGAMVIGKMTLYFLEPGSFKLLWRGEAETIIKADGKTKVRITKTVKKLLDDFPARQ